MPCGVRTLARRAGTLAGTIKSTIYGTVGKTKWHWVPRR